MLSSSNYSSSEGPSDLDDSSSCTMNSSCFTDESTSINDNRVDIGKKQDNHDKAGTEQPYPYPDSPENILELATKILQRFGLEKEDLENLLSYPEDQITVTNLPAILEQICIMKKKKTTDGSNFPRVTSTTGFDRFCSEGEQIHRVGFDGVLEETTKRRSSAEGKNWGLHDQKSSSTSSSSVRTFVDHPPSNLNNLQTQPNQSLQSIFSSFPLVTQETDRNSSNSEGSEPKSNWSSTPEMKQIAETKQFVSIPGDGDPDQAINDMCKNDSKTHGQVTKIVEKNKKSKQKYQKIQSYSDLNPVPPPSMRPTCPPEAASTQWLLPPSGRAFLPDPTGFNGLPPQAMMEDYVAATPGAFPHICSLCRIVCVNIEDWIIHQNISFHIKACILLRKTFPNWDCTVPLFESFPDKDASTSAQTSQRYDHSIGSRSRCISPSRLEDKCCRSRSSSCSPGTYFRNAWLDRSRPEEREDPNIRRSLSPSSMWRGRSDSRSHQRRSSSGRSKKEKSSPNRRHKRSTMSSSKLLRSSTVEQLTKKLLRTSAVQSLMKKPKIKTVVRTLVPIILAELRNLKSSSSSSSSHSSKKKLDANFTKVKSDLQICEPGSSRKPEVDAPKVKRMKSLDIQETSVTVVKEKEKQLPVESKVLRRRPTKPVSSTDLALHSTRNNAALPKRRMRTSRCISKTKALVFKSRTILTRQIARSLKLPGSIKLMFTKKKVAGRDSRKTQKELKQSLKGLQEKTTEEMSQKPKIGVKHLQEDGGVRKEENEDVMEAENLETLCTEELKDAETLKHLQIRSAHCVELKTTTAGEQQRSLCSKPVESYASSCSAFTPEPADLPQTEQNLLKASVGSSSQSRSENQILEKGTSPDFKQQEKKEKKKRKKKATKKSPSAAILTFKEHLVKCLSEKQIGCLSRRTIMSPKLVSLDAKVLLIKNLPSYFDGCYREDEVADLLRPFGFVFKGSNIYVIPEKCMAFALMPSVKTVQDVVAYSDQNHIVFKGYKLTVEVVHDMVSMTPLGFYSFLIKRTHTKLKADGGNLIFIHNVSQSEVGTLRETLIKIGSVTRYLPLLNKVFVEFENRREADMLGVWYSLLKRSPGHQVYRMKIPHSNSLSPSPNKALPDGNNTIDGTIIPTIQRAVPQGSTPPFWITMTTEPLVFPTHCPWFNIPDYLTVSSNVSKKTIRQASKFCTVMLTGLPESNYTHQDVAKLVWKHFPKQNLQTLFYNVVVLPLQRRAFVFFSSWDDCSDFVINHIMTPVSVKGSMLSVHLVLEDMQPGFSEETMYRSVMKWSNAHISELQPLEDRLLCVEISDPSTQLVMVVMKQVASVAAFVNFLPLANRIVIELAEPSGVSAAVLQILLNSSPEHQLWSKVTHIELLKTLKGRLRDASEAVINLESDSSLKPAAASESKPDKRNLRSEPETPSENFSPKRRKLELSDQSHIPTNKYENETTWIKREEDLQVPASSTEDQTKNKTKVQKPERLSNLLSEDFQLYQTMKSETNGESIAAASRDKEPTRTTKRPKGKKMVHKMKRFRFYPQRRAGNISNQKATKDEKKEANEEEKPANETRKLPKSSLKVHRNLDGVKEEVDVKKEDLRENLKNEENSGLDFYHP